MQIDKERFQLARNFIGTANVIGLARIALHNRGAIHEEGARGKHTVRTIGLVSPGFAPTVVYIRGVDLDDPSKGDPTGGIIFSISKLNSRQIDHKVFHLPRYPIQLIITGAEIHEASEMNKLMNTILKSRVMTNDEYHRIGLKINDRLYEQVEKSPRTRFADQVADVFVPVKPF